MIPVEIDIHSHLVATYDEGANSEVLKTTLDLTDERRARAKKNIKVTKRAAVHAFN